MTHRVLVIGVGSIGERHVRCFQNTGRATVSICEPNDQLRQRIAETYSVEQQFASLEDALSEPLEAAVIAAPAPVHVAMATALLKAGKHVLIEKPLATSMEGVAALLDLERESKRVVGVGYTWRSHPVVRAMRAAIDEGRFGRPRQIVVQAGQHFPTFRPAYRDVYFASHATGGGAIQDAMTHMANIGEFLVGPIDRLCADASHQELEGVEVEDTVHYVTRQGDVLGSYALTMWQNHTEIMVTVSCDRTSVRADLIDHTWQSMDEKNGQWREEGRQDLERDDLYVFQANRFLDAIEGKAAVTCTLAEAAQTLGVNLAALRSCRQQCWERVNG